MLRSLMQSANATQPNEGRQSDSNPYCVSISTVAEPNCFFVNSSSTVLESFTVDGFGTADSSASTGAPMAVRPVAASSFATDSDFSFRFCCKSILHESEVTYSNLSALLSQFLLDFFILLCLCLCPTFLLPFAKASDKLPTQRDTSLSNKNYLLSRIFVELNHQLFVASNLRHAGLRFLDCVVLKG